MNITVILDQLEKLEKLSGQDIDSLISLYERRTVDICPDCAGSGFVPWEKGCRGIKICGKCDGKGTVPRVKFRKEM